MFDDNVDGDVTVTMAYTLIRFKKRCVELYARTPTSAQTHTFFPEN